MNIPISETKMITFRRKELIRAKTILDNKILE
jgi:hypothetical protein